MHTAGTRHRLPTRTPATAAAISVIVASACFALFASSATGEPGARVTMFARPVVVDWAQSATLFGAAAGAGPADVVKVETKECGSDVFRPYVEAHVSVGGGWSAEAAPGVTSTFRVVWRGSASNQVTIRQRAKVVLTPRRAGPGYTAAVVGRRSAWRKRVVVERRVERTWRAVKSVVLADSVRSTGTVSVSQATFRLSVPKGTQLRAVLPLAQAKPCYVRSVSRTVRA